MTICSNIWRETGAIFASLAMAWCVPCFAQNVSPPPGYVFEMASCDQELSKYREVHVFATDASSAIRLASEEYAGTIRDQAAMFVDQLCPINRDMKVAGKWYRDLGTTYGLSNIQVYIWTDPSKREASRRGYSTNRTHILSARSHDPNSLRWREYEFIGQNASSFSPHIAVSAKQPVPKYTAQEMRAWDIYEKVGGDEFLAFYRADTLGAFRSYESIQTLVWLNSIEHNTSESEILRRISDSLIRYTASAGSAALVGGNPQWADKEHGSLYPLYIMHKARSKNQSAARAYDRQELHQGGFVQSPSTSTAFHAIGLDASKLEKWVHPDGREYVYLRQGTSFTQVFDGVNDGTYNYCKSSSCHTILDIFPWVLWGASVKDTTAPEQRAATFRDAFVGLSAVKGAWDKWAPFDF